MQELNATISLLANSAKGLKELSSELEKNMEFLHIAELNLRLFELLTLLFDNFFHFIHNYNSLFRFPQKIINNICKVKVRKLA